VAVNDSSTNFINSVVSAINRSPIVKNCNAIFDTGTTGHYMLLDTACTELEPTQHPICVTLANGHTITSTHTAKLLFAMLLEAAQQAHVFLSNHALLYFVMPDAQNISTRHQYKSCTKELQYCKGHERHLDYGPCNCLLIKPTHCMTHL
jgi:hypothetical protein